MTTVLILIIRTSPSELPFFAPDIFTKYFFSTVPGQCNVARHFASWKTNMYGVWQENESLHSDNSSIYNSSSLALSDNNIIRIMSDLSIFSSLSLLPMVTPHTSVQGLFWCSGEAWGSALCYTEYVGFHPWHLMIDTDLFLMSQFYMWEQELILLIMPVTLGEWQLIQACPLPYSDNMNLALSKC